MLIVVTRWKIDNYLLKTSATFSDPITFFQISLMFRCSIDNLLLLKYPTLCGVIFDIGIQKNESPILQYWRSYSNISIIFSDFIKFNSKISSISHFMPGTIIQTEITRKKISYYMDDSCWRRLVFQNAKTLRSYVKYF